MKEVIRAVLRALEAELQALERRALAAAEGATHEESRPEGPKDTRALETSYLAHGLARRARGLEHDIETLRFFSPGTRGPSSPIGTGAMVVLEDDEGSRKTLAVLPCAGGTEIRLDTMTVRVVTPGSPLGAALLEKCEGDEITVRIAGAQRDYVIAEVRS